MAKKASCSLSDAWRSHWDVLFPGERQQETMLGSWVKNNLLLFDCQTFRTNTPSPDVQLPGWSESLSVAVNRLGANLTIANRELESGPWFANTLIEHSPQWDCNHREHRHPLEKLAGMVSNCNDTARHWIRESERMVRNVTLRVGEHIRKELSFKLRAGHLEATGYEKPAASGKRGVIAARLLNGELTLDIIGSSISFLRGRSPIVDVRIQKGPFFRDKNSLPRSFEEYDVAILERMKVMIDIQKVGSVRKAAENMAGLALCRGDIESAISRLERGFSKKYSPVSDRLVRS